MNFIDFAHWKRLCEWNPINYGKIIIFSLIYFSYQSHFVHISFPPIVFLFGFIIILVFEFRSIDAKITLLPVIVWSHFLNCSSIEHTYIVIMVWKNYYDEVMKYKGVEWTIDCNGKKHFLPPWQYKESRKKERKTNYQRTIKINQNKKYWNKPFFFISEFISFCNFRSLQSVRCQHLVTSMVSGDSEGRTRRRKKFVINTIGKVTENNKESFYS